MPEPRPPETLFATQTWFASWVTRPLVTAGPYQLPAYASASVHEIGERISPGVRLRPEERLGIYNQQYWWRLFTLLHKHYPALVRLFGYADFNAFVAEPYFTRFPPDSWLLAELGSHLPLWMEECYQQDDKDVVLPVARVDAAYERLFQLEEGVRITLVLDGDFLAFRSALLAQPPEYWQTHDFPQLISFETPREFVLWRTPEGIRYR